MVTRQLLNKRLTLLLAMLCGGFFALLCLLPLQSQARERELVLRLKWFHQFQFAGYYAAQKMGYYREAGMKVAILPRDITTSPVAEVLSGKADFGISDSSLVLHKLNGEQVVVLACIFQNSPMVLISLAERQMVSPLDFTGDALRLGQILLNLVSKA